MKSSYSNLNVEKRRRVKAFQQHACYVLTEAERETLYKALKEYQTYRSVEQLVRNLKLLLNTPEKKDLVLKIRQLIPPSHVKQFDQWLTRTKLSSQRVLVNRASLHRSAEDLSLHQNHSPAMRARKHKLAVTNRPRMAPRIYSKQMKGKQEEVDDVVIVSITKAEEESLGFAVRGGSEHGLGIYVSQVDEDSAADFAGLSPGDQILEVNDRTLGDLPSSIAVKILTATNNLRLLIKRTGKVPGWRYSSEQISWYDTEKKQIVKGNLQDYDSPESMLGPFLNGISERRVNINARKREQKQGLGFNIRGGSEFGLGIYVSRVDRGGLAEQKGIRMGDQVVSVNGASLQGLSHSEAVDFLRTQSQLILTVRYIGRFPVLKEMYAEYQWLNGQKAYQSRPESRSSMSDFPLRRLARVPQESKIEVYTQTDDEDSSQLSLDIHTEEVLPLQTEILMPHSSQFILRDSEQQLNSSGSDLEDLLLEHFENGVEDSFHEAKDRSFMGTSSGGEDSRDVSPERASSRKSHRKKNSIGRKSLSKHDDTLSSYSGSIRIRGVFEKSFGSQVMHRGSIKGSSMMAVEERCRALLSADEAAAVVRHIHTYKETNDIERLVQLLLVILDKPDKVLILRDIRGVIRPTDIGRFDSMVTRYERQASLELKTTSAMSSPVRNVKDKPPRTRKLMDPVTDLRGSFHLEEHGHFTDKYRKGDNSNLQSQPAEYSSDPEGDVTSQSMVTLSSASPHKRSDIIFLPATTPNQLRDMPEYAEIHRENGHTSRAEDGLDTLSVGSSVSSVDSLPVAFDEADLPPGWLRSSYQKKVEMRSYTLVEDRKQSLKSSAKDTSNGPPSPNKTVTRSHDPTVHSPSRSPSRGESVRSESHASPHHSLSRNSSRSRSPVRYVTAMGSSGSLRGVKLSSPPPPLLISPAASSTSPVTPPHIPTPSTDPLPMSPPPMFKDALRKTRIVYLSKHIGSLGLSISGGRESKTQPQVKVEKILPGGSAAQEGSLQAGMTILSVDGESLLSVTHTQAVDVIRRAWNNTNKHTVDVEVEERA